MAINAKNLATIKNVAKKSDEKSQILSLKWIEDKFLLDYPRNNEDTSYTEDIELSIQQNGFTDPIEVTDFGMEDGFFMIVSGHRRRCAGRKQKMDKFPCIIKHFESEQEVYNYVLLSNSQRDSAKDPLLYCKRYKMHEEYLKESGFKGSVINEVAKRLGLSPQHAERYSRFNRVIMPYWELVRNEKVGMSSLLPLAVLEEEQQKELYDVIVKCIEEGIEPTRTRCKAIIDRYKEGVRGFDGLVNGEVKTDEKGKLGIAVIGNINIEPGETPDKQEDALRNGEINYDTSHREGLYAEAERYKDEKLTEEDMAAIDKAVKNEENNKARTEEEVRYEKGEKLQKNLSQSLLALNKGYYDFRDKKEKGEFIDLLGSVVEQVSNEIYDLSTDKEIHAKCVELLKKNQSLLARICKDIVIE